MGPLQIDTEKAKEYGLKPATVPEPKDLLISPNEAARILNVTDQCVRQWIYHSQLNATKLRNGYWRIRVGDIEEYIKARGQMDRKRVVILCPEAQARKAVIAAVEAGGYVPIDVADPTDALLKTQDVKATAFIVDVAMPGQAGWRFLKKVRKLRHARSSTILLLSDKAPSESDEDKALKLGAHGFLVAPVTVQQVEAELRRALEGWGCEGS